MVGDEEYWDVSPEISNDMTELYWDLLKTDEKEWKEPWFGKKDKDCKKFLLLRFMLCPALEYYDEDVYSMENNVNETFYDKPEYLMNGLIGYNVPLWKKWWRKYKKWDDAA